MSENKNKATAVVVNDNTTQLNVLCALARKAGLEPLPFAGAEAALAAMNPEAPPDIVVTDLYMSGLDGWRFCRLLRSPEYAAFNKVPILVVSATFAGDHPERIATDAGADAFLPAPVNGKTFVANVRALLLGKVARPRPRVLIVEDDADLAHLLCKALAAHGYQADAAATLREARDAFALAPYDVAVLDYYLPDGTGDSLLDAFRTDQPGCACVLISGDPSPGRALDWMKRGAAACLHKPFLPETLVELCARARRERTLLRSEDLLEARTRELRESEETHRALVDGLPDIVMRFDREGRHLFVSDNVRETVDMEAAQFIGKTHAELGFPEAQCRFWEDAIRQVFDSGQPFETEFTFEGKAGPVIFNWRILPERDAQGAVSSVLSISRDITAHRKAEQKYQALFREMLDGFALHEIILDTDGTPVDYRFLAVNPAFERMTGLKAGDIAGRTVLEVLPGTERHWIETYGKVALTGEPVQFMNHSADLGKHFEVTAYRPAPGQFACTFQDITERKRAEEVLCASEEHLAATLRSIADGVIACDAAGAVVSLNAAAEALTGWTTAAAAGKPVGEVFCIVNANTREAAENPVFRALREGVVVGLANHTALIAKDGAEHQIADSCAPIRDASGKVSGAVLVFRDVTVEYRQREELRKAQLITENVPVGLMLYRIEDLSDDRTLRMVYANPAVKTLIGLGPEDVVGKTLDENFPGLRAQGVPQRYAEVVRSQTAITFEDLSYGDDRVLLASFSVRAFPLPGNMVGVAFEDITERKRAEQELARTMALLQAAIEQTPAGMLIADAPDVTIRVANPAALGIRGESAEPLTGIPAELHPRRWLTFWPDGTPVAPEDLPLSRAILKGETVKNQEVIIRRGDGEPRHVLANAAPVRNAQGEIVAGVVVFPDVTEFKQAEEALRESEARYRLIADHTSDSIWVMDAGLRFTYLSPSTEHLFGYTLQEWESLDWGVFVQPGYLDVVTDLFDRLRSKTDSGSDSAVNKVRHKDGRELWVEFSATPVRDQRGELLSIVGVTRDITERKRAEGRQGLAAEILGILNEAVPFPDAIDRILGAIKRETGFDAVGIRLRKDEDYPYFVQNGFSEEFLLAENSLVERGRDGGICRGKDGRVSLECTCGLVLSEKTDPSNPLFTPGGSFWTNDSMPLLDIPPDQEPRLHPRNRCIHAGFQSVALMPIRSGHEIIGLLQLNDRRKGCLTAEMIRFFEGIAASIGVALARKRAEEMLQRQEARYRSIVKHLNDAFYIHDFRGHHYGPERERLPSDGLQPRGTARRRSAVDRFPGGGGHHARTHGDTY